MPILGSIIFFLVVLTITGLVLRYLGIKKLVRLVFMLALLSTIFLGCMPVLAGWTVMSDILLLHLSFLLTFAILLIGICAVRLDNTYHVLSHQILKHMVHEENKDKGQPKKQGPKA